MLKKICPLFGINYPAFKACSFKKPKEYFLAVRSKKNFSCVQFEYERRKIRASVDAHAQGDMLRPCT